MSKIIAITTVRNESDIVESFCRYTLTFCDQLIINDNSSKDTTAEIISRLVDEGLPIILLQGIPYNPCTRILIGNYLLDVAMQEHAADIVLPIDVDEFLITTNGTNPRTVIEAFDPLVEYQIPWRTYVRSRDPDGNNDFLPNSFSRHREDEVQQFFKTVVSRQMHQQHGCTLSSGSHTIEYPDDTNRLPIHQAPELFYAHYPVRNSYQAMQKAALGFFNNQIHRRNNRDSGFQYNDNYEKFMQSGWFTDRDVEELAKYYAVPKENQGHKIGLVESELDVYAHARPLGLKYTDYSDNQRLFMITLLSQVEEMLNGLLDEREVLVQVSEDKDAKITAYQNTIDKIMNSNSWRFTKPLRTIGNLHKKKETD